MIKAVAAKVRNLEMAKTVVSEELQPVTLNAIARAFTTQDTRAARQLAASTVLGKMFLHCDNHGAVTLSDCAAFDRLSRSTYARMAATCFEFNVYIFIQVSLLGVRVSRPKRDHSGNAYVASHHQPSHNILEHLQ